MEGLLEDLRKEVSTLDIDKYKVVVLWDPTICCDVGWLTLRTGVDVDMSGTHLQTRNYNLRVHHQDNMGDVTNKRSIMIDSSPIMEKMFFSPNNNDLTAIVGDVIHRRDSNCNVTTKGDRKVESIMASSPFAEEMLIGQNNSDESLSVMDKCDSPVSDFPIMEKMISETNKFQCPEPNCLKFMKSKKSLSAHKSRHLKRDNLQIDHSRLKIEMETQPNINKTEKFSQNYMPQKKDMEKVTLKVKFKGMQKLCLIGSDKPVKFLLNKCQKIFNIHDAKLLQNGEELNGEILAGEAVLRGDIVLTEYC